jgi:hypothetical protein
MQILRDSRGQCHTHLAMIGVDCERVLLRQAAGRVSQILLDSIES